MTVEKPVLIGCGIFKAEIDYLCEKNNWSFDSHFLPASLHIDFKALKNELTTALACYPQRDTRVFYGACHPFMAQILNDYHTQRTEGQNCVEMLLGRERFMSELEQGAFFLLEEWVLHWESTLLKTFGHHPSVVQEIFQQTHRYFLCINTPCSHDFSTQAQHIGETIGLPVKSITVSLDFLEHTLQNLLNQKRILAA